MSKHLKRNDLGILKKIYIISISLNLLKSIKTNNPIYNRIKPLNKTTLKKCSDYLKQKEKLNDYEIKEDKVYIKMEEKEIILLFSD